MRDALDSSDAEIAARAQVVDWGRALGLAPFTDDAANLFLRLEGADSDLPPVLAGSHIDSQPTGGKFDGTYGVLAALEAVTAAVRSVLSVLMSTRMSIAPSGPRIESTDMLLF